MERQTRINIIIRVGLAFWPLHCRVWVGPYFIFPCAEGNSYYVVRSGLRAMGLRVVSYAGEDVWVCINHQVMVYPTYGS
jgi:hypothetical protein